MNNDGVMRQNPLDVQNKIQFNGFTLNFIVFVLE